MGHPPILVKGQAAGGHRSTWAGLEVRRLVAGCRLLPAVCSADVGGQVATVSPWTDTAFALKSVVVICQADQTDGLPRCCHQHDSELALSRMIIVRSRPIDGALTR